MCRHSNRRPPTGSRTPAVINQTSLLSTNDKNNTQKKFQKENENAGRIVTLPYDHHDQIIPLHIMSFNLTRRAQLRAGPVNHIFLLDAEELRRQFNLLL